MKVLRFCVICVFISISAALQCRTTNGPSDEDLKRVARTCMRKIGETTGSYHRNQSQSFYSSYNDRDYDEYNRDDRLRQMNQDRFQVRNRRMRRSANDRARYELSSSTSRNQQQNQRSKGNNYNHNNGNGMGSSNNSSRSDRQSRDMQQEHDGACVVHCFFDEMNMLNNDDYPDKHKVMHILTRDIRERELRSFYTDTIQECFSYLEMQRRKDKCQFSKELINCMMQYARANCDDWQDHTLIFS